MEFSKVDIKELACFVCEVLTKNDIDAVLVGGACVSIYSHNRYQSYDLDFVSYEEIKKIEKALLPFDFKRNGRYLSHNDCPYFIDFVTPPIAIGKETIHHFEEIKGAVGRLRLLTPTDCVKDRLAAFFHWNDLQSLEQAFFACQWSTNGPRNQIDL